MKLHRLVVLGSSLAGCTSSELWTAPDSPQADGVVTTAMGMGGPSTTDASGFDRIGDTLVPVFEAGSVPSAARSLGVTTKGGFTLADGDSGITLAVAPTGAADVAAESSHGIVVYRDAFGAGTAWLVSLRGGALEDYALLTDRSTSTIEYTAQLGGPVAGLRVVGGGLEVLDAAGTPHLRVLAPVVHDASGASVTASVDIAGCAADRNTAEPWGRAVTAPGATSCTIVVSWPIGLAYPVLVDPSWKMAKDMSVARLELMSALLANGRVLAAGGMSNSGALASAEVFDPATKSWALVGSMTTTRYGAEVSVTLPGDHVLVAGGANAQDEPLTSSELYDGKTGSWSTTSDLGCFGPPQSPGIALADGRAFVICALASGVYGGDIYDPTTGAWSASSSFAGAYGTSVLLLDGRVLVAGGDYDDAEIYDPAYNYWTAVAPMNKPRSGETLNLLASGQVLAISGDVYDPDGYNTAETYDVPTNTWTMVGSLALAREPGYFTATTLASGGVMVVGNDVPTASVEVFDPTSGKFAATASYKGTVSQQVANLLPSGDVLVAGGIGSLPGSGSDDIVELATSELYTP